MIFQVMMDALDAGGEGNTHARLDVVIVVLSSSEVGGHLAHESSTRATQFTDMHANFNLRRIVPLL